MHSGKEYVCVLKVHGDVGEETVRSALELFTGRIYQVPPVRSAVARKIRARTIYRTELIESSGRSLLFKVACSGGTYVRKLCYDIGLYLGCGAHMQELRRIRAGPLTEKQSRTLLDCYESFKQFRETGSDDGIREVVHPVEDALALTPKIHVLDSAVDAICHGAYLAVGGISKVETEIKKGDFVAVLTLKDEVVALGVAEMTSDDMITSQHGIAVDIQRVIMERGVYPAAWKSRTH